MKLSSCDVIWCNLFRAGQGEVGGYSLETLWLALGGPFLSSYAQTTWPREQFSHFVGPSFPAVKLFSQSGRAVAG